ncbi:glycosyltransferase family 2 protein [Flavobacterium agrisoli]|uniref:Glycosyltransferase family 2 protein n=1 Tax=Flavobacterium agrisoli TaxID=2793066 RepID=A0A934UJG3_9FLAO|nr:glycosyltransferase family 2 protein [Flavobacterium agrisoli]MBK0369931.1 glycosyltransferase family 2 protein [Flavobacterium agrisoli]
MQLSVVILNYNVRYFLELCLISVEKAIENLEAEIIVVDNNSTDDSCQMMQERFPHIKCIQNQSNAGFPKGNNIGVTHTKGKYLCILNPDTVVAEDTFIKILNFAQNQTDLGIIGCKLIDGTGAFLPESKRGIPTPWVAFTKVTALYKFFPNSTNFNQYYAQHLSENQSGEVPILVGAFMVMEKKLYNDLNGFDENCFMYADDIDLSYRALLQRKKNYYFADTSVIHYKGESTLKDASYMLRFQEAMTFFYKKHFQIPFWFGLFMNTGIYFFSIFKRWQPQKKTVKAPKKYFYYSQNPELPAILEHRLQNKVAFYDLKKEKMVNSCQEFEGKPVEFLIDNAYLSFKKTIAFLESKHNQQFTFKILPKNTNFLIGSDSSTDRGQVIQL